MWINYGKYNEKRAISIVDKEIIFKEKSSLLLHIVGTDKNKPNIRGIVRPAKNPFQDDENKLEKMGLLEELNKDLIKPKED